MKIMKVFLPVNIRIDDKKILFVGGGSIAMHKMQTVEQYARNITILAPRIDDKLKAKGFCEIRKEYEKTDLEGFFLVYACTNDLEVNRRIKKDAEELRVLVNVADNSELSDFISPAVFKLDEMTVAISSNGQNAKKSVEWRNRIKAMLQES
ncbi:porphyrin biosynthesis protein, putative [Chlorobium phaeobacteroides DSM 266]|uniref:precorrin-2 dehydrogenase n=2 Tax=Chlorobium phaeobacteroides TaxID=1096 RepID=A1BCT4_CHLPD|nr:porphyrin biosynthesis protein, putative [Chlorobium phaeobacteroides DSM 266]